MRARTCRGLWFAWRYLARDEDRGQRRQTRKDPGQAAASSGARLHGDRELVTPLAFERIAERWFSLPNFLFLWWIPAATALVAFAAWRWLDSEHDALPFLAAIALFLLGYLGLVISNFPYLVPPSLTIWQTAAAPATQIFMLMGTLMMLPIIIGYMIFVYWTFGGKLREGEGYHSQDAAVRLSAVAEQACEFRA
jgi:cytochrome bd-type quinol oxidase subunit 2